ncbi:hypothetical protein [Lentzea flava]|uniref:DUF3558 domain-containing protein n=1 Tax=Lentzea flava TaxID=103732 RepID=A0ABQ2UH54_9PSEU|nr:hypothetical protein [Lentzea flava]GGU26573.1 hypothetical protein GCM10010178_18690 [Lentzea flava]
MRTKPHRTPKRPFVVLASVAMMIVAGCSAEPVAVPTFSASTSSSSAPGPAKYASATFRTCEEIQQKEPELPPAPVESERGEGANQFTQECEFTNRKVEGVYFTFRVILYETKQDGYGFHSAAEVARTAFGNTSNSETEKDVSVNIGSEARWVTPRPDVLCRLEVLDENAILSIAYQEKGSNSHSEHCRQGARDVARKIYAAVQPN